MARLSVIGVIVSDLNASIEFYSKLGLEFPDDLDQMVDLFAQRG